MFLHRDPTQYFYAMVAIFLVLPVHEWAHAYTAYLLGDHTARFQGRMTLDPTKHLTLMGSICAIFFGFGWAKPVPINPYNFTQIKDRKLGFAICALAGPMANFLMGLIFTIIYKLLILINAPYLFIRFAVFLVQINISLMVFNFLPVPPLDGSRIWSMFLKDETYNKLLMNEQKITLVIFLFLFTGLLNIPLSFLTRIVIKFLDLLTWFI